MADDSPVRWTRFGSSVGRLFARHPLVAGIGTGVAVGVLFDGVHQSPKVVAGSGLLVGVATWLTWRDSSEASVRQLRAQRYWLIVIGAVVVLAVALGVKSQSDSVLMRAYGSTDKATVTFGTPGNLVTKTVALPW